MRDTNDKRFDWDYGAAADAYVEFDEAYQCGRTLLTQTRRVKLAELTRHVHIVDLLVVLFLTSHMAPSRTVPADALILRLIEDALGLPAFSTSMLRYRVPFAGSAAFKPTGSPVSDPEASS